MMGILDDAINFIVSSLQKCKQKVFSVKTPKLAE